MTDLADMTTAERLDHWRERAIAAESKLDTIRRGLNGVLVRNQNAEASDGDSMSVLHELFYQWFQREPPPHVRRAILTAFRR